MEGASGDQGQKGKEAGAPRGSELCGTPGGLFTLSTSAVSCAQRESRDRPSVLEFPSTCQTTTRILQVMDVCIQISMNVPFKKRSKREGRGCWENVRSGLQLGQICFELIMVPHSFPPASGVLETCSWSWAPWLLGACQCVSRAGG